MNVNNKISLFRNYRDTTPALDITIQDFCGNIVSDDYRNEVLAVRDLTEKADRDRIKSTLPAVTISGTFSPSRANANLKQHSGWICLDFDQKGNPDITDWPALRNALAGFANVLFAALSASGKGVFLIIPILYPEYHLEHFLSLEIDFASIGLTVDKACKDVSRLRGISFDPDAVINPRAETYRKYYQAAQVKRTYPTMNGTERIDLLIKKLINAGVDITTDYSDWFELGRALANVYGESGRGYFHQLSQFYPDYKHAECDKQYSACLRSPGKATEATIFELAKKSNIYLKN